MAFHIDTSDPVAVLTFDRPPVNAFDPDLVAKLEPAARELAKAKPLGLVITGAGKAFSAGVDTRAFAAASHAERAEQIRGITRTICAFYGMPFPVVSAVNGHAMGGGFVIMLAGDVRLAVDDPAIRCGLQEAQAGIPFPAGPLEVIRAELSHELLRWLTLTSAEITTTELAARGVIDRLVAPDDLLAQAKEAVRRLAAQPGFGLVKAQVRAPTVERLKALVASGTDPLIEALAARG